MFWIVIGIVVISGAIIYAGWRVGAAIIALSAVILCWLAIAGFAMTEINTQGYTQVAQMKGHDAHTDALIVRAQPVISLYEFWRIKQSYLQFAPVDDNLVNDGERNYGYATH